MSRRGAREISFSDIIVARPFFRPGVATRAIRLSRLGGADAFREIDTIMDAATKAETIGLSAELRVARLIAPLVEDVRLSTEDEDFRGIDLVARVADDHVMKIQVKAGARTRRVETTTGLVVIIAPPHETDAIIRREIRRVLDGWIDARAAVCHR